MGLFGRNCSCLADDALKIFEVYWKVSDPSVTEIPPDWPDSLSADFNMSQPASLPVNNISANIFWAVSIAIIIFNCTYVYYPTKTEYAKLQ